MRFVKFEEIKAGMRSAKPIYNKKGVLLYGRNTVINNTFINNTRNLDLYGIYIIEPTEPLPVMTEEEIEFERFQTVVCYRLKDELNSLIKGRPFDLNEITEDIIRNYGRNRDRINFLQSLRSNNDYPYKHALSVAMMVALICNKLNIDHKEKFNIVQASLLHDIGKILAPSEIINKSENLTEDELKIVKDAELKGYEIVKNEYNIPSAIRRYIIQLYVEAVNKVNGNFTVDLKSQLLGTKIIKIADMFDILTAMRVYKEPVSEYSAVNYFFNDDEHFDEKIVNAIIESINILPPGACVELTNGEKGLVISENEYYVLRPTVLGFNTNSIYDLAQRKIFEKIQIKDIMKTMDNRFVMKDRII